MTTAYADGVDREAFLFIPRTNRLYFGQQKGSLLLLDSRDGQGLCLVWDGVTPVAGTDATCTAESTIDGCNAISTCVWKANVIRDIGGCNQMAITKRQFTRHAKCKYNKDLAWKAPNGADSTFDDADSVLGSSCEADPFYFCPSDNARKIDPPSGNEMVVRRCARMNPTLNPRT